MLAQRLPTVTVMALPVLRCSTLGQFSLGNRRCRVSQPRPSGRRSIVIAQGAPREEVRVAVKKAEKEDPSPYFEPLVRSLLLGLSCGVIFESLHVALKWTNLLGENGFSLRSATDALPSVIDRFAPLFVGDHVVAVSTWILFYVIEAAAIFHVLKDYSDDAAGAKKALGNLVTLPKKMLPLQLQILKQILLVMSPKTALAPNSSSGSLMAPTTMAFVDDSSSGTAVLERTKSGGSITLPAPLMVPEPVVRPQKEEEKQSEAPAEESAKPKTDPESVASADTAPKTLQEKRASKGLRPGAWDVSQNVVAARMKELTGRRSYLKNFWYAAAISERVQDKPVGVELAGQKLSLWRGEDGTVHCVSDVCPHRGAPLHMGWSTKMKGHDCLVCPYHGWAFDDEGFLQDVPALENGEKLPDKPMIDAYPVVEKGGFIWLFYGSKDFPAGERPPIPYVPELDDPTWRPVYGEIEFDCNHWGVFENAIDMAHIHYLHSDTFGNQDQPEIRDMRTTADAYGVTATFALHNKPVSALWEFSKVPEVRVTAKAFLPSTSVITFTLGQGLSFTTFVNTVPISATKTVNRFCLVRNLAVPGMTEIFNMAVWDRFARQAMMRILGEDKAMVEKLRPDLLHREVSVRSDLPQIAFRKLRQEYINMGYGQLPEASDPKNPDF